MCGMPSSILPLGRHIPVKIYTDIGPFEILPPNPPVGTVLVTNEKADEIVGFAAKQWTDVGTSSFQAQVVGDFASIGLPDVKDAATAALVFGADNGGGIHIVYDADAKACKVSLVLLRTCSASPAPNGRTRRQGRSPRAGSSSTPNSVGSMTTISLCTPVSLPRIRPCDQSGTFSNEWSDRVSRR